MRADAQRRAADTIAFHQIRLRTDRHHDQIGFGSYYETYITFFKNRSTKP